MSKFSLSIIIPIFNEANNIEKLTDKIKKNLSSINFEIIFVDDNSLDNSKKVLKKLKSEYRFFNPIFRNKKRDLTQSCFDGIKKSRYPKYIPKMINLYQKNSLDIVVGSRPLIKGPNNGLSETRRLASKILIYFFLVFNIKTSDPMSGYFLFKKKLYLENQKNFFGKGFKILADFLINSRKPLRVKDYLISFKRRYNDKSKMNYKILYILIQFYLISLFKNLSK